MMRRIASMARDARGAVAVELGLAAPILAVMLIGLVDMSTAYSNKLRLEQIAQRVIEKVQAAGFETSESDDLEAEAEAAAVAAGFIGASAEVTFWLECNGARAATYTEVCTTGPTARYVQLDIEHSFEPVIAARFGNSNADGTMTARGIAGIRIQ